MCSELISKSTCNTGPICHSKSTNHEQTAIGPLVVQLAGYTYADIAGNDCQMTRDYNGGLLKAASKTRIQSFTHNHEIGIEELSPAELSIFRSEERLLHI